MLEENSLRKISRRKSGISKDQHRISDRVAAISYHSINCYSSRMHGMERDNGSIPRKMQNEDNHIMQNFFDWDTIHQEPRLRVTIARYCQGGMFGDDIINISNLITSKYFTRSRQTKGSHGRGISSINPSSDELIIRRRTSWHRRRRGNCLSTLHGMPARWIRSIIVRRNVCVSPSTDLGWSSCAALFSSNATSAESEDSSPESEDSPESEFTVGGNNRVLTLQWMPP